MASYDGGYIPLPYTSSPVHKGQSGSWLFYPYPVPETPQIKFSMRAWETGVGWVTWISYGTPDPNPPSGIGPVTGVTETASWE